MGDGKHRARSGTRRGVWRCVNRGGRCVRGPAAGLEARGPAGDSVESGSAAIDDVLVGWRPSELRRLRARSGRGRCARAGGATGASRGQARLEIGRAAGAAAAPEFPATITTTVARQTPALRRLRTALPT